MARRIVLSLAIVCTLAIVSAAATIVVVRERSPDPAPTVKIDAPAEFVAAAGDPAPIPLPATGSLTLSQAPDGVIADRDGAVVRPVGSVAKTMTALVVLTVHPLQRGESGPSLTMTAADVTLYRQAVSQRGSAVAVAVGERLSERELLLALMLPSANNIAETLARWVSGSRLAFVAQLNQRAAALGMSHTHFDDPSGYSDATVSTTHDLVILGQAALSNPALAELVSTRSVTLPDGSPIANLDILLSVEPGWLGIKTGWTPTAGGCLLFAAQRVYAGGTPPVTVVGAVLGQPALPDADPDHPELGGALRAARLAVSTALDNNVAVDMADLAPHVSASVTTRWGSSSAAVLGPAPGGYVVVRRGAALALTASVSQPSTPVSAGSLVGRISGRGANGLTVVWPVRTGGAVQGPSFWWKLFSA